MKKLISILIILTATTLSFAQCTCSYSYTGAAIDTVTFTNLSVVSNAHYYWDLGDGSGSNETNPTHIYYSSGEYLVTLYGLDTISNCSNVYETWISVTRPDTVSCNVFFTDTIIGVGLQTTDLTSNCLGLYTNCRVAGPGQNYCVPWLGGGWVSALFLHSLDAFTNDSIRGYTDVKDYFRTRPYLYNSNKNYQNCSANFEINIDYQHDGALATFTAMNKNATSYEFEVIGFGNPIYTNYYIATKLYPYYYNFEPWLVVLRTHDTINNCSDTVTKQFIIINPNYSYPSDCSTSFYSENQFIGVGSNVEFMVATSPYVDKQWQQNAGLGFIDLYDAGPYSGVHTDTLTVSNVQLTMNNFHYRCVISGDSSGCHNTLPDIILTVHPVGINEIEFEKIKIYPNPAHDYLLFDLSENVHSVEAKIFNLVGELKSNSSLFNRISKIDISDLSSGIYFIEITMGASARREKFVVE
jgi:hypothetical protein